MPRSYLAAALVALLAPPLAAQEAKPETARPAETKPQEPDKPVTQREPSMGDAMATPVSDLGLKKDAIPPLLIAAQANPYDGKGLRRCAQIAAAIGELDAVLGPDLDLPPVEGKPGAGRVAQAAVGAFIPFRGLIREISGANANARKMDAAIEAGVARRAYLKGLGEARGCRYPARPAGPEQVAAALAPEPVSAASPAPAKADRRTRRKGKTVRDNRYVSQPVVQSVPDKK